MRALTGATLLVTLLGCASTANKVLEEFTRIKDPPAMSLIGRFGYGHACPIANKGGDQIVTAAHVVYLLSPSGQQVPMKYTYQQGNRHGFLSPVAGLGSRDLAFLRLDMGDKPKANKLAEEGPRPGEKVYWYEYNMRNRTLALQVTKRSAKVVRTVSGHIVFVPAPVKGASGGCLLNGDGEVVGIVAWGMDTETGPVGVGPSVVGDWRPF